MIKKYKYKVLYAEDNLETRENYYEFLKLFFEDVYVAKDGLEAYEKFLIYNPHIIILDINMPKLDGISAGKKIREISHDVKILMFTAYAQQDKLLDAIDIQVTKYILKPVKISQFESIIDEVVTILDKQNKNKNIIKFECGIFWDNDKQLLHKNNQDIKLSKKEYELISFMVKNIYQIYSSDSIINHLWYDDIDILYDTKPLRSLLFRLKTKLDCQIIESVYNQGYRLKVL